MKIVNGKYTNATIYTNNVSYIKTYYAMVKEAV